VMLEMMILLKPQMLMDAALDAQLLREQMVETREKKRVE
jgi:hypothetical protein